MGSPVLTSSSSQLPLRGLRVVDLSDRLAGAYCTKLLVDAGADVVKVEPPSGDPLRSHGSAVAGSSAPPGALFNYLCASKRSIVLDLDGTEGMSELRHLLERADVVVETWIPGEAERRGLSATDLHQLNPALSVISISSFGRGGPRSTEDLPEFLLQALSGAIYARGRPGREPLWVAGGISEWVAGAHAATAGMGSFLSTSAGAKGRHVDVSILEAAATSLVAAPVVMNSLRGYPLRTSSKRAIPGIERCSDGWVGLYVLTAQQWFDFTGMIGRPDLAEDTKLASLMERQERPDELVPPIEEWTTRHTVDQVLELAELLRIPAAPIGNGESLPEFDVMADRGVYQKNPGGFRQPRSMFRFGSIPDRPIEAAPGLGAHSTDRSSWAPRTDRRAPVSAAATSRPLEGVRVVDLTAFWAGPFATAVLSALGAQVIKVESIQRPDPLRFTGFLPATQPRWYEAAAIFNAINLDKQDLTLDLGSEEGRGILLELVGTADVVVENFTARVLDNFNLGYEQLAAVQPGIILARMPAFGLDGPWRDRPGFAPTMEQMTGLAWINGYEDTEPIAPNGFVDPAAGAHLAFAIVSALVYRREHGRGLQIELPMVEVATTITAEQVIEFDLAGNLQQRHGNAKVNATPQGVYACKLNGESDSDWIALSVQTDHQWRALAAVIDARRWVEPSLDQLDGADGRWKHRHEIDEHISTWCLTRSATEITSVLADAGVPAVRVAQDKDLLDDPQMQARGFWEKVSHPVIGDQWYAGFPFLADRDAWYERSAPLLGQDNDEILQALGFTSQQVRELEERKVIGRTPLGL